jgi:glycerol-3-phosphate dehydrogenase (NAD(P)+)
MNNKSYRISIIGAGTIGTALGNVLAETAREKILLHSIEAATVNDINKLHINSRYFPAIHLHKGLLATTDNQKLEQSEIIFLAVPSVVMIDYLKSIRNHLPSSALFINLAKGFGYGGKTIIDCLQENFPNPVGTLKGPSFAREIINRLPTGFTFGHNHNTDIKPISKLFEGTNIHLDYSGDMLGVELLSILKNIYAVVLGIIDAQFNSPNLRFMILTKAFREMRRVLKWYGGSEETLFNYCGYGDFTLTALNDLSRNRTLGLLIGKGFFTEHVSHDLVLEGKTAANTFYAEMSLKIDVKNHFPIIAELYHIFNSQYDISQFVDKILSLREDE